MKRTMAASALVLIATTITQAKDNPNLLIHAWCIKGTPQWPSCIPKREKCTEAAKGFADLSHCRK